MLLFAEYFNMEKIIYIFNNYLVTKLSVHKENNQDIETLKEAIGSLTSKLKEIEDTVRQLTFSMYNILLNK